MIATVVNAALIVLGCIIGVLFKSKISSALTDVLMHGLALIVAMMGIRSAIATEDILGMIICMVVGTLLGELLNIEKRLDRAGDLLKKNIIKKHNLGGGSFTEGFVSASLLFCVGSMAILGTMEAGVNHNYTIIFSKSIIDCVAAISFSAVLGIGVGFSAISVFIYQGLLTLLAIWVAPFLSDPALITEISAIGGILLMGIAINMIFKGRNMRVGNMMPAMFMPIIYLPLSSWLSSIF